MFARQLYLTYQTYDEATGNTPVSHCCSASVLKENAQRVPHLVLLKSTILPVCETEPTKLLEESTEAPFAQTYMCISVFFQVCGFLKMKIYLENCNNCNFRKEVKTIYILLLETEDCS